MGHHRLNLLLGATLAGVVCIGNTATAFTGASFAWGLHASLAGAAHLLEVAALPPPPPPPPPPPAQAPVPEPTARTSSVVTALEHLGRVWESPPPDRAGVGTLAERFKTLFRSAGEQFSELGGQTVDQIVATVAGPGAVASLNAAYEKVRRAYAAREALPRWHNSAQYQYFQDRRGAITQKYRQRALDLARKNVRDDRIVNDIVNDALSGDYPIDAEFLKLRLDRDAEIAKLGEGKAADEFAAAYVPQAEAAQKAYEDALAELDTVSQDLLARFDQGTDVEYTLDASVTPRPFDDVSSGCLQSVADGSVTCGRKLSSDFLDEVIEARESKTGKFYQELRKILAIPEDQRTQKDKLALAKSISDLFGARAGGFGTIADAMQQGYESIDKVTELGKEIDKIINRDSDDPLAELKAFKRYLEVGQTYADKVPGIGQMYQLYVKSLDGIIDNAKVISSAASDRNKAIEWVGDVYEGRYDEPKQKKDTVEGKEVLGKALSVLSNLDRRVFKGSLGEGKGLNPIGKDAVMEATKAEREDFDKAGEAYRNIKKQQKKEMDKLSGAMPQLEKILERLGKGKGAGSGLAKKILAGEYRELFNELGPELIGRKVGGYNENIYIRSSINRTPTVIAHGIEQSMTTEAILKKAEPGYNETVAERIGAIAAKFPRDKEMQKLVKWAEGQRKLLADLGGDKAKAALIQARAEKRLQNRLAHLSALALTNRSMTT